MRKLTVLIDGPSKVIDLQESILIVNQNPHILLKKASDIFWQLINVTRDNFYKFKTGFNKQLGKG